MGTKHGKGRHPATMHQGRGRADTLPLGVSRTTGKPLCAVSRSTCRSLSSGTASWRTTTGEAMTSVTCTIGSGM